VGLAFVFLVILSFPDVTLADDENRVPDSTTKPAVKTVSPVQPSSGLTEREQWLLDRVEQLEKRVAELEAKQPKAASESARIASFEAGPAVPGGRRASFRLRPSLLKLSFPTRRKA